MAHSRAAEQRLLAHAGIDAVVLAAAACAATAVVDLIFGISVVKS
jgi:hypothetical protein